MRINKNMLQFEAMAAKARQTKDSADVREAMRFAFDKRISNVHIRRLL